MTSLAARARKKARVKRLDHAIDVLASLYDGGHLLASSDPAQLLRLAVGELLVRRREAARYHEAAARDREARPWACAPATVQRS